MASRLTARPQRAKRALTSTKEKPMASSKYGNRITEVDGIKFQSQREAKRYSELQLMLKAGLIADFQRQVPFLIRVDDVVVTRYIADFVYFDVKSGRKVVEDAKGYRTPVYRLKKRFVEAIYKIKIIEV